MAIETPTPRCPQCGAPVQPPDDDPFLNCPFCATRIFLDAARAIRHVVLPPRLDAGMAASALARWLKDREVVGAPATVASDLIFFPVWEIAGAGGKALVPAAGALYDGLEKIEIPEGDVKAFAPERIRGAKGEPARAVEATVPLEAAVARATGSGARVAGAADAKVRLIHVPLHAIAYAFHGTTYHAAVDACGGRVHPVTAPRSSESRLDRSFAGILAGGLVANLVALSFFRSAPLFSLGLLAVIAWSLYAAGLRLGRWMES